MKILHIITSLGGGGRERRMVQLVHGLDQFGYIQHIALILNDARTDYGKPESVNMTNVNGEGSRKKMFFNLKNLIKTYKPDIVHVWTEVPTVLLSLSLLRIVYNFKLVVGFLADGNPVTSISGRIANHVSFYFGDAIVSNSNAGLIAKKAPSHKSIVIYNGFDFNRFNLIPFDRNGLLTEINAIDKKIVTMCARFSPAKNWDMFVDIAAMAKQNKRNDLLFLAVGGGALLSKYKESANSRGLENIYFLGQRNDVENLLKVTNVAVLFSNDKVHAEGVSNSIMEAMAAGCPVIATNGGGTPEIVEDGITGFIVEPNDTLAAYSKLISLTADAEKLRHFGEKGVERIHKTFTLSEMTNKYIALYNSITNNK